MDRWRFPIENIPRVLGQYAEHLAPAVAVVEPGVALATVIAAATAIGGSCRLSVAAGWDEPAALRALYVEPPGDEAYRGSKAAFAPLVRAGLYPDGDLSGMFRGGIVGPHRWLQRHDKRSLFGVLTPGIARRVNLETASRAFWIAPPDPGPIAFPRHNVPEDVSRSYAETLQRLIELPGPTELRLTQTAAAAFLQFHRHASDHEATDALLHPILRLALVIAVTEFVATGLAPRCVYGSAMIRAIRLGTWFASERVRFFAEKPPRRKTRR